MSQESRCQTTHLQILAGGCPCCKTVIGAESPADAPGERRWDISRLKVDLNHADTEARMTTIGNAGWYLPDVAEAVDVLRIALSNSEKRVREAATTALVSLGRRLADDAIDPLEVASLKWRHRDDLAIRIVLLGHYNGKHRRLEATREARQALVLWIIEHAPRSVVAGTPYVTLFPAGDGLAYQQGGQRWIALVEDHPEDTVILGNAAGFFTLSDRDRSEELLRRARALDPEDPVWSERLAHLYRLAMFGKRGTARRLWAAKAQAELEWAQGLYQDEQKRLGQLHLLAECTLEAGDHARAEDYASELLSRAETEDRNIFYGHQILARVALAEGDVERAKSHLLASAGTAGCPLWSSTFRSMALAKDLLDRGEQETVRRFLERCALWWPENAELLTEWVEANDRREKPIFLIWE